MKKVIFTVMMLSMSSAAFAGIRAEVPKEYVRTGKVGHGLVCADMADTAKATQARLKKKVRVALRKHELIELSEPVMNEKFGQVCVTMKYNEVVQKPQSVDLYKQLQQSARVQSSI